MGGGGLPRHRPQIEGVAELLLERAGAGPGDEMLDVATGSGNVAIPAALAGASVIGLDLTPELLEAARRRAAAGRRGGALHRGRRRGAPVRGRAKAALEPQGRWEDLRGEMLELYREANEAEDGSFAARAEYLLTVARMPA